MANTKKPRKKYKPQARTIPVTFRFNEEDENRLQLTPHLELSKLRNGAGDDQGWHTIVCRLNIGITLAIGKEQPQEVIKAVRGALDAMLSIKARNEKTEKWGASGEELKAIGEGLVLTDDLQKAVTRRDLRDAMRHVFKEAAIY